MTRLRPAFWFLFLLWIALPAAGQNGDEPIQATDLLQIRQLGNVSVSPHGRNVLYTVRTTHEKPDEEGQYEYRSQLYLLPRRDDEPPRPLTQGREGASQPDWHPDGDRIAFVRPVDGTPQIFVLPLVGGEPYQLTDFEHGATNPRWSPDGSRLLFSSSLSAETLREQMGRGPEWPDERPGRTFGDVEGVEGDPTGSVEEIRAWLDENQREQNPRILHRLDFQGEHDLEPERSFSHLFIMELPENPATAEPGSTEPIQITEGFYSFGGGEWLPHGEQLILSGAPVDDTHPDRVRDGHLYVVDPDGDNFQLLLEMEDYALYAPTVSPNGGAVAFLASDLGDPSFGQSELGLYLLDGSANPELLTREFDRSVGSPTWSPDGWYLYLTAASEGGFPLYRIAPFEREGYEVPGDTAAVDTLDLLDEPAEALAALPDTTEAAADTAEVDTDAPPVERLTDFARGVRSFDVSTATVYYVLTEPTNPYELYTNNAEFNDERRLTEHNAVWLADKRLSEPEPLPVTRGDTLEVDAWIMRPAFFKEGRTYPMLLQIHGGPSAMWGPGEASMWHEFQFFASRGYGVVYSNPRGSGGYGRDFQAANFRDWGHGPAGDVLAAASRAAEEPWIDPDRQVVTGGSYAGYLTAWIVTQDHRFQAAAAQRGVYDLPTFLGEGNAWRLVPYHFGGYPWEGPRPGVEDTLMVSELVEDIAVLPEEPEVSPRETLIANSPLTYVDQIRTPLLILHADQDLRTGVIQSEMLYKSLKILERPVEYVRYPNAGHDLSRTGDPRQRIDRILRMYEFFERYIDHQPPAPAATD